MKLCYFEHVSPICDQDASSCDPPKRWWVIVRRGALLKLPVLPFVLQSGGRVQRARYVLSDEEGRGEEEGEQVLVGVIMQGFDSEWHDGVRDFELSLLIWL